MKRILIINLEYTKESIEHENSYAANVKKLIKTSLGKISGTEASFELVFKSSLEEIFSTLKNFYFDLVIFILPERSYVQIYDFCSVLRQQCFVIPILALGNASLFPSLNCDVFLPIDTPASDLLGEINNLIVIRNIFDENLIQNLKFTPSEKLISYYGRDVKGIQAIIDKDIKILAYSYLKAEDYKNINLFLIDIDAPDAIKVYKQLKDGGKKLKNKHALIVHDGLKNKTLELLRKKKELKFLDISKDKYYVSSKINSLIRYDQIYTAWVKKIKKSIYQSTIDSTTKVYTRAFLDDYLTKNDQDFQRFSALVIDIDKFKNINDKYGHYAADEILKNIATLIKSNVRSTDIVARYGGDEFIVIMKDISEEELCEVTKRIQKVIANSNLDNIRCSVSIGGCYLDSNSSMTIKKAIFIADKYMYIAKQEGGNTIKFAVNEK